MFLSNHNTKLKAALSPVNCIILTHLDGQCWNHCVIFSSHNKICIAGERMIPYKHRSINFKPKSNPLLNIKGISQKVSNKNTLFSPLLSISMLTRTKKIFSKVFKLLAFNMKEKKCEFF